METDKAEDGSITKGHGVQQRKPPMKNPPRKWVTSAQRKNPPRKNPPKKASKEASKGKRPAKVTLKIPKSPGHGGKPVHLDTVKVYTDTTTKCWRVQAFGHRKDKAFSFSEKTIAKAEFEAVLEQEAATAARIEAVLQNMKVTDYALVNVPLDCDVNEAVKAVELVNARKYLTGGRSTMIVLGKGEHHIDGRLLVCFSAINIVGDSAVVKEVEPEEFENK